jgi:histidine triad (HIT) family protein
MPIVVPQRERCAFCSNPESRFAIVEKLAETVAFLPPRQAGLGHVLVIPRRHAPTLLELERAEALAIMHQVHRVARALARAYDPAGLNVFQNNGVTAGQTVPHYHVHIVPTYAGDQEGQIFRSEDIERTPHDELLLRAERIRAQLEPPDDSEPA